MGGIPLAPIPVKMPNDLGLEPGETTELWYFDGVPMGGSGEWKVAGLGTVSADGKFIVTNPGQGIPRFRGVCGLFCFADNQDRAPNPPCDDCEPGAPNQTDGKPITLATGQELATATDLVLDGDPAIVISRRFNPFDAFGFVANYTQSLGVNWTFNYDVALLPFDDGGQDLMRPSSLARLCRHPSLCGSLVTRAADHSLSCAAGRRATALTRQSFLRLRPDAR